MKKNTCLIPFLSLLFLSKIAHAADYNHFYLGGDIGIANLVDKESTPTPAQAMHHLGATGLVGGGFAGYDFSIQEHLKLGIEWFMNATNLNASSYQNYADLNGNSPVYTAHMKYNLGIRALPGYAFTPDTIGYAILGYSYGKFNIQDNGNYGYVSNSIDENGFQCGAGIRTPLWNHIYLRTDVLYTLYASSQINGISTNSEGNPGTSLISYTNNFSTLEADVGFVYKFD